MSWKNWPSWKKGGVIGCWVYVILFAIYFFMLTALQMDSDGSHFALIFSFIVSAPSYITSLILPMGRILDIFIIESFWTSYILIFIILNPLGYFIIGALIGWIIGKIKSRGKRKK